LISIAETIAVPCPPQRLWEVVSDPADVVSCIGGAELGEAHEDGSFDGTLVVRFGGVRVKFAARITLELEESELLGRLCARGRDGQAATKFSAEAVFRVEQGPSAGDARVSMDGQIRLTGKLASLIESGAGIVVSRMTKEFAERLIERCTTVEEPALQGRPAQAADPAAPAAARNEPTGLVARIKSWWRRLRTGGNARLDGEGV
jgi:carbon monoxide dehydrogenase subunit G